MTTKRCLIAVMSLLTSNFASSQQAPEQSELGQRLVADGYPFLIRQSLVDQMRADREHMKSTGYMERSSPLTRAEYVLAAMDLQRNSDQAGGRSPSFIEVENFDASELGVELADVPAYALGTHSRGYVLQATANLVQRIYTDTSFGTLLIDEHIGGRLYADGDPDMVIVGQPAWLSTIRYPGNKWATTVAVHADSGRLLIVQADRRFDGPTQDAFIKFIESLVLSTY